MFRPEDCPTAVLVETPDFSTTQRALEAPAADVPALKVAIAGSDRAGNSTLQAMLEQSGLASEVKEWAWLNELKLRNTQDVPEVVFLDLSAGMGAEFIFAQELSKLRPSVHIIACSAKMETNPEFLLQAMRSGIRDFLQKPYSRGEVAALMHRLADECGVRPEKKASGGRLFVVLGTKGGVGTSTVAVNLAVQLSQVKTKRTLLMDFSRPMGDIAALLDLKPSFQIRDALENVKRLDATLLRGLLTPHKSGMQVLAGAQRPEDWQEASAATIERIVDVAQQEFDFVVMDLGAFYSAEWRNVLSASEVLLISEADLPGLGKLHKHLGALARLGAPAAQTHLVINRWHRQDEEAVSQIASNTKMPVFARLPNNFKQVTEATVRGVPVVKNSDGLAAGFEDMATKLTGTGNQAARKKSRLGQLFSV
ncbi:MAG TPA: AAA family ATPase [Candidatus Acidoferrum sp.]|nr:AAA family ATPase [Candidatus Acidoferrum sp.]